jgi:hypothetical protein
VERGRGYGTGTYTHFLLDACPLFELACSAPRVREEDIVGWLEVWETNDRPSKDES